MTADSLDPRRDKLVAALYGELSAEEEQAFRAMLAADEALRAEWEELTEARAFLQEARSEEQAPQFVFLSPLDLDPAKSARGRVLRPHAGFWAAARRPALGFALGAAALLVLVLSGLRADRQDGALVLRFGAPRTGLPAAHEGLVQSKLGDGSLSGQGTPESTRTVEPRGLQGEQLAGGIPLEPSAGQRGGYPAGNGAALLGGGEARALTTAQPYLTRDEFADYSNQIVQLMAAGFSSYEQRRQQELRYLLSGIYNDLQARQERDRDELNAQFAEAWLRLAAASASGATRRQQPFPWESAQPAGQQAPEDSVLDKTRRQP
jgi:hypothetical protein